MKRKNNRKRMVDSKRKFFVQEQVRKEKYEMKKIKKRDKNRE